MGPRPLLVSYIPRYNEEQHRRHEVRPGLLFNAVCEFFAEFDRNCSYICVVERLLMSAQQRLTNPARRCTIKHVILQNVILH